MKEYIKHSNLKLERYPQIPNDTFLAWDASDQYIINQLNESPHKYRSILIIEDDFGALGLSIKADKIYYVNDSILSQKGISHNYNINNLDSTHISFLSPYEEFPDNIDLIIIKIPKVNKYLDFLLNKLNFTYCENTPIIAGSMLKYLNSSIYELCRVNFNQFQYSLSWKKAKVIRGTLTGKSTSNNYISKIKAFDITLTNFPNLFSSRKLDIGTRFFLDYLSDRNFDSNIKHIIDVGSANGVLGLSLISKFSGIKLWLTDISYSAYESACATISENNFNSENIEVIVDNSLDYFQTSFADLIVLNPPFHQNHKVSISTSLSIFVECARVLKDDGELLVIANKHLGYHKHLSSIFPNVDIVQHNDKFMIISAKK